MSELSINHCDIFVLLYNGNIPEAVKTFQEKTKPCSFTPASRISYLSSLNFGVYNYILLKENVSLHDCCLENEKKIAKVTQESILTVGADIITAYGMEKRYMIEKYRNPHIKKALYYIHEHISEPLTLTLVSEAITINASYLCQLFKKEVNMGFSDYITCQRVKIAQNLLITTDLSMVEIAHKCGFKNSSYFCTCYKKYYGISPSQRRSNVSPDSSI